MRFITLIAIVTFTSSALATSAATASKPHPCREIHTFDFWVGTFDARPWNQPDAPVRGQLRNTLEYDGCVIVEHWAGAQSSGMSMSFYDVNRDAWRMIWIGDDGQSNDFEGSYSDGAMRFNGWVLDSNGKRILARNVLQNVSPGLIRHVYSTSPDGGKTWSVKSDGRFERRATSRNHQSRTISGSRSSAR